MDQGNIQILAQSTEDILIVSLEGSPKDEANCIGSMFEEMFLDECRHGVVDLTKLKSCSGPVLSGIQHVHQLLRTRNRSLNLIIPDAYVLQLLKYMEIESYIFFPPWSQCPSLFGNLEEAINHLSRPAQTEGGLNFPQRDVGEYRVIEIRGKFRSSKIKGDMNTCLEEPLVQAVKDSLLQGRTKLLIDLEEMLYADSSFVHQVQHTRKIVPHNGGLLWLLNPTRKLCEVMLLMK